MDDDQHIAAMDPIKIGFVLPSHSSNPLPSTRIAVLNMIPFLRAAGYDPHIVFEPERPTEMPDVSGLAPRLAAEGYRLVYVQKVFGPSVEALVHELSRAGIHTIYGVCDHVVPSMVNAADATITVTEYLKSLYPDSLQPKIHVVHDGIEHPDARKTAWNDRYSTPRHPMRAVLVTSAKMAHLPFIGSPPPWLTISIVGNYPADGQNLLRLREAYWHWTRPHGPTPLERLSFALHPRIRRIAWGQVRVYEEMQQADIAVIPVEAPPNHRGPSFHLVKSENRLTLKMAFGLPVIATPIPAYERVIEHGVNGFLAATRQEWLECLDALRDPRLRRETGERARSFVIHRFSMQEQARGLIEQLDRLARPSVSSGHR